MENYIVIAKDYECPKCGRMATVGVRYYIETQMLDQSGISAIGCESCSTRLEPIGTMLDGTSR